MSKIENVTPKKLKAAAERSMALSEPVFRKLTVADSQLVEAHMLRLDPENRRLRFCAPAGDAFIRKFCSHRDWPASMLVGAFVDGTLRGVGELVRLKYVPQQTGEVALSVEAPYQNAGIGSELLRRLLTLARNRCINRLYMLCISENTKMQAIARKFDANLLRQPGEVEGRISPSWPSYGSMVEEMLEDGWAFYHAVFDPFTPAAIEKNAD